MLASQSIRACDNHGTFENHSCGCTRTNDTIQELCVKHNNKIIEQLDYEMAICESNSTTYTGPTFPDTTSSCSNIRMHFRDAQDIASIQGTMNPGYASDDEASELDDDELCDSGRTRSSTRRSNQVVNNDCGTGNQMQQIPESEIENNTDRGNKRKKSANDGDGEDSDDDNERNRKRLETDAAVFDDTPACSCRNDVMKCIGILPSLPIIGYFHDSDDSDSSFNDELSHTILPRVSRSLPNNESDC